MLHIQRIDSFELPELAPYRTLRYQFEHRQQGIFVAAGEKVVRRLIESKLEVVSVMLPSKWLPDFEQCLAHRTEDIRVFVGEKELLERLTGFSMYQGVLAVGKVPSQPILDTILQRRPRPWLFLAADELANAQNMGVLVRNCAAFAADALLVGETCCSPFLRRAVRASMGTVFYLPLLELHSLAATLHQLRALGIRCIAAHPHTDRRTLPQADFTGSCCIVLGSEGQGLSAAVLAECDEAVAIPMPPHVDSLNVGSASAVFLYEAARQRGGC
ncbi:MAG: RNA methyltransferase [Verrucomicrobia bacterium]|nr:RNA methyltransferase [Verrucomicrobiota bacterium]